MARTANLLDTRTATFLDLIGNGKMYRVPSYQRDYSWEEEQWEDLWSDIEELSSSADARHYMGALVVEAKSDREFLIIDGQQRIATLSIFALAIIDVLLHCGGTDAEREDNAKRATGLRNRFIGERDPASLLESSKLFLNESDDGFYQDYLVQLRIPNNLRALSRSNRSLWDCFQWFGRHLSDKHLDGAGLARLLDMVARQLLFILVTVDDDLSAYTVFETLNARGMELSATDLLKNYLFSCIKQSSDLIALQRRWKVMLHRVKQERFPDFLRYHLLCDNQRIRKERLFKLVRDQVRSPQQVFDLMDVLEIRAELFAAFNDPEHEFWIDNREAKPYIRDLQLFHVRQMTPLLFAAWERLSASDFVRVLKLVSIISFRYTVICERNANELEVAYHRAAKALLCGQATLPAHVFEALRTIYVPDEAFITAFADKELDTTGSRKRLAKFILCRLETDSAHKECDYEGDPVSIEHILPENPADDWNLMFPPDRQQDFIYRIGNLTLLETKLNRQIGNGSFTEKKLTYEQSAYSLTKKLADVGPPEWTPDTLRNRQRRLADRAAQIWRSDFV